MREERMDARGSSAILPSISNRYAQRAGTQRSHRLQPDGFIGRGEELPHPIERKNRVIGTKQTKAPPNDGIRRRGICRPRGDVIVSRCFFERGPLLGVEHLESRECPLKYLASECSPRRARPATADDKRPGAAHRPTGLWRTGLSDRDPPRILAPRRTPRVGPSPSGSAVHRAGELVPDRRQGP